jgi:hypothetical protein
MRKVGDVPYLAERFDEILGGITVIFDDKKAHGVDVGSGANRVRCSSESFYAKACGGPK